MTTSTPSAGTPDIGIVDGLVQLSFLLYEEIATIAAVHGLSITQTRLLGILRDREPGMLALARLLGLEKSSATGLVDRAEKRGLVQRIPAPDDRRAIRVQLTAEGRQLVHTAAEQIADRIDSLTRNLSSDQRRQLSTLVTRVLIDANPAASPPGTSPS
jgi:DNA-binding MarR family transcriptional regulator